jgi:hypothetical protein
VSREYLARVVRRLAARIQDSAAGESGISIEVLRERVGQLYETQQTPDQLLADVNDYDLGARGQKRLSSDADRAITGILAGTAWTVYELWNVGSFNITLKHQSGSSTAANRIICGGAADIVLAPNDGARARYDATTTRWRAFLL